MVYFYSNNPRYHELIFWLGFNFLGGKLSRFKMWWYLKKPHICSQNNENHMCCKKQNENDGVPCTSFTQQLLLITKCPKHYVVATKESIPGWLLNYKNDLTSWSLTNMNPFWVLILISNVFDFLVKAHEYNAQKEKG